MIEELEPDGARQQHPPRATPSAPPVSGRANRPALPQVEGPLIECRAMGIPEPEIEELRAPPPQWCAGGTREAKTKRNRA